MLDPESAPQRHEMGLRRAETALHAPEMRLRDAEMPLREAEIAVHGAQIGSHDDEIALPGPASRSCFAKSLYFRHLAASSGNCLI